MKKILNYFLGFCFAIIFSGCSMNRMVINQTTSIIVKAMKTYEKETNLDLARQSIGVNLKLLEGLLEVSPKNSELLLLTARGFALYSFGFIEDEIDMADKENNYEGKTVLISEAVDFYERAMKYGLQLIAQSHGEFPDVLERDLESIASGLQKFEKRNVPELFWTGFAWGRMIFLQLNDPSQLANLPKVELIMKRVLELDENYFYGGVHLFYGAYYGGRPRMFGGDLVQARSHLEHVIELTDGKYLVAQFFLAQYYAVPAQEKVLYQNLLQHILSFPINLFPEQGLANQLVKRKASRWIEHMDELFFE